MDKASRMAVLFLSVLLCVAAAGGGVPRPGEDPFTGFLPATSWPETRVIMSSKLDENVRTVTVEKGDRVKPGQVLLRFDDDVVEARINVAKVEADFEARLQRADVVCQYAQDELERLLQLEVGVGTTDYEIKKSQFEVQRARLERDELLRGKRLAEAQLKLYEAQAEDFLLRSPIDGIVADIYVEEGEMASQGQRLLEIVKPDIIEVRTQVDERYAGRLCKGGSAEVRFVSFPDDAFRGTITHVPPYVASGSGYIEAEVTLRVQSPRIRPGMECEVRFLPEEAD